MRRGREEERREGKTVSPMMNGGNRKGERLTDEQSMPEANRRWGRGCREAGEQRLGLRAQGDNNLGFFMEPKVDRK